MHPTGTPHNLLRFQIWLMAILATGGGVFSAFMLGQTHRVVRQSREGIAQIEPTEHELALLAQRTLSRGRDAVRLAYSHHDRPSHLPMEWATPLSPSLEQRVRTLSAESSGLVADYQHALRHCRTQMTHAAAWNDRYWALADARTRAAARSQAELATLTEAVDSRAGLLRLRMIRTARAHRDDDATAPESWVDLLAPSEHAARLARVMRELSVLQYYIEQVTVVDDASVLADLRDNEIGPRLDRVREELRRDQSIDSSLRQSFDALADSLRGPPPASTDPVDAPHAADGGTIGLCEDVIALQRDGDDAHQRALDTLDELSTIHDRLKEVLTTEVDRLVAESERTVASTYRRSLVFAVCAVTVFSFLGVWTARRVQRSVDALNASHWQLVDSETELRAANESLQEVLDERSRLEGQLVQAQKLEAVGQLAAGIAHEINTPIQYVGDNTRFMEDGIRDLLSVIEAALASAETDDPDALRATLRAACARADEVDLSFLRSELPLSASQALEGVHRVSAIVRAMKSFSHPGDAEPSPADLNAAIESTATVCRNRWKYVAELELDFEPLPAVMCQIGEINQVILNLIVNAADAIDGDRSNGDPLGRIVVRTRRVEDTVVVEIEDSGPGIPDAVLARIFDPFFTTKDVGKGTGQGLAIAHDVVVNKHHGRLTVENIAGSGARFCLHLPLGSEVSDPQLAGAA